MVDVFMDGFPALGIPLLVGVALFAFWVWALVDCLRSDLDENDRLVWAVVIILLHALGALIYVAMKPSLREKEGKPRRQRKRSGRLARSPRHKVFGGVCGGLAERWGVNPVAVRLLWVAGTLVLQVFPGVLVYIIFWAALPEE